MNKNKFPRETKYFFCKIFYFIYSYFNFDIKNMTNMKKLLLLAAISIFLSACASTEKPIPEYKLIPNQTTLKINNSLYHQNSISNQQK